MLLSWLSLCERIGGALVAPAVCAACERPIAEAHAFCPACAATIERGDPEGGRRGGSLVAVGTYGGALGDAIRRLKYQRAPWIARPLGDLLAARCLDEGCAPDLVVPVPMPRERLLDRGYNHAALLATRLGRVGYQVDARALERTRADVAQATLRRDARLTNLRGAFRARRDLRGVVVLLVDDVITTGGTLAACRDAIVAAGGTVASAAVVAVVDQEDDWLEEPREDKSTDISSANPPPRGASVT